MTNGKLPLTHLFDLMDKSICTDIEFEADPSPGLKSLLDDSGLEARYNQRVSSGIALLRRKEMSRLSSEMPAKAEKIRRIRGALAAKNYSNAALVAMIRSRGGDGRMFHRDHQATDSEDLLSLLADLIFLTNEPVE